MATLPHVSSGLEIILPALASAQRSAVHSCDRAGAPGIVSEGEVNMPAAQASAVARPAPTIVAQEVDGVRVAIHGEKNPSAADWEEALDWTRSKMRMAARPVRYLILSQGGAPNSTQRAEFNKLVKKQEILTAILTSSTILRGMVTAMAWINSSVRAFREDDVDGALLYLGVPAVDFKKFSEAIAVLRAQLRRGLG
jgi:hypothetical protein